MGLLMLAAFNEICFKKMIKQNKINMIVKMAAVVTNKVVDIFYVFLLFTFIRHAALMFLIAW